MAMVSSILPPLQVKDSRWLTLEVCREFQRNKCTRSETECKFAHPPPHVEVQNGRVTCCFDSIKGKCQRKDPPCKYLHPPQHLREQLLQNGRNNLILRNLQMQAIAATNLQPMVPGMVPADKYRGVNYSTNYHDPQNQILQIYDAGSGKQLSYPPTMCQGQYPVVAHPYLMQGQFSPYMTAGMPPNMTGMVTGVDPSGSQVQGLMQQTANTQQKMQRADRLESTTTSGSSGMDSWPGSYAETIPTSSQYSPIYFQGVSHMPNMMPMVKRQAVADSKSGIPMYQPGTGTTAYQQAAIAMQLQPPFVPVTIAGHPSGVQRL